MADKEAIFPPLDRGEYLYGQRGVSQVRDSLSRHNPAQVIAEAQRRFQVQDPRVTAGYPLADHFGVSRRTLHADCIAALTRLMVERIEKEQLVRSRFLELFNATFPQITESELRSVPIALCRKHPEWVPVEAYAELSKGEVYEACPLEMKRLLWLHEPALFSQHILPTVKRYTEDPAIRNMACEIRGTDLATYSKERREHSTVKELTRLIGSDLQLYNRCIGLLRGLFSRDGQPMSCMLRFDLLMAMHDADVKEICNIDPCHKLVWSLDACIRTQQMDERRVDEMRRFFETMKSRRVDEGVYGDLGIVLYDPFASNMIAGQLLQHLHGYTSKLARLNDLKVDKTVQWAAVVLNLGVHALHMIRQRDFQIPRVPRTITSGFFAVLVRVMADDQRHSGRRWTGTGERPQGIGSEMEHSMSESVVAQMVFAHYILERLQRSDFLALSHALPSFVEALPSSLPQFSLLDQLVQSLVTLTLQQHLATLVTQEAIARLIIEEFLLACVHRSAFIHEKTMRLIQAAVWRTDGQAARTAFQWTATCARRGFRPTDAKQLATLRDECYGPILERSQSTPWRMTRENASRVFDIVYGAAMDFD